MPSDSLLNVLITGATSGIGKALANRLAQQKGYRLILLGRRLDALSLVAEECRCFSDIAHEVISVDLSLSGAASEIASALEAKSLTVDILVNNAGLGCFGDFKGSQAKEIQELIQVNIVALVELTHLLLQSEQIASNGHIINVSSVYAYCPVPKQALYAASKAFVQSFSLALAEELAYQGLAVSAVCPGTTVNTRFRAKLKSAKEPKRFAMTAEQVAASIEKTIKQRNKITIPGGFNRLFVHLTRWVPERRLAGLINYLVYRVRRFDPH